MFLCSLKRFDIVLTACEAFLSVSIFLFLSTISWFASSILSLFSSSILFSSSDVLISCLRTQMLYSNFKSVSLFASKSSMMLLLKWDKKLHLLNKCWLRFLPYLIFHLLPFHKLLELWNLEDLFMSGFLTCPFECFWFYYLNIYFLLHFFRFGFLFDNLFFHTFLFFVHYRTHGPLALTVLVVSLFVLKLILFLLKL